MESPTLTTSSSPVTQSQIQVIQPQNQVVTVKLNDSNYLLWKMQVLTVVKGCGLLGYLTGAISAPTQFIVNTETNETKINPEFESFTKQDQLLASWMLSSLSESVLILVVGLDSSADIWRCLETNFSSQSKARMMQYKLQLQTLKKGTLSMREYLGKAKAACDALASAGQKLSEEDQLLHILSGLPSEYNPVIVTITSAIDFYSLSEASALLLSFESREETLPFRRTTEAEALPFKEVDGEPTIEEEEAGSLEMADLSVKCVIFLDILLTDAITGMIKTMLETMLKLKFRFSSFN
ncbi:hypothetical protein DH2020_006013 [Rehmannia glutinosa]|uniref:Retrotransposon Copia-like N-terminal domain-containing protein n=1 Tax=Rehmannia glutinosa TaxID=99300 RepID=A0ABR0XHQ0_REHGL